MNSEISIPRLKSVYGGELSAQEFEYLETLQQRFRNVVSSGSGFREAARKTAEELRDLAKRRYGLQALRDSDWLSLADEYPAASRQPTAEDDLRDWQRSFAEDLIGALGFVMRNRIGFRMAANVLAHDLLEVLSKGEPGAGFRPKASGWARHDSATVGDPEAT